ncbi:MAG: hypothetical protein FWG71_06095 [Synergistaceae bacterium]|nr:hypothetical protein [Synergistaceae bacterium]
MKTYIDGQEYTDDIGNGSALSILSAVRRRMTETGRVVTEIRLDDVVMDEDAFSGVSGGLAVYFTSRPVRELVLESLDEAIKYIPRLTRGLDEIALHFEKNELAIGEGKLADGAEGLDWLLQVFQKCSALLAVDADSIGLGFSDLQNSLGDSINFLGALHSEKQYLKMALCVRQKLVPEIEKFSAHVQRLRDLASSTQ